MATKELSYIIRAVDEASKTLKTIKGSMDDLAGGGGTAARTMNAAFGFFTKETGEKMKQWGQTALSAIGSFTDAADESVRNTKALEAVLKSTRGAAGLTAKEIQGMASSLQQVTNFEDDTILRGQNLLLTFTRIGKDVFPQTTEAMLNLSTAMRTDVQSAAIQLGKALNDPVEGISALTRVGVSFTDEQKNMIQAMAESGNVAGAQKLILQELETEFGGLARATADTRTQMGNSFGEIKEEIGKTLLPAFDAAAKAVLPILQNINEWIVANPELVKTIGIVVAILGGFLTVVGSVTVAIGTLTAALGVLGISLAMGGALVVAIIGITTLVTTLIDQWEGLKWMVGNAIEAIVTAVKGWAEAVKLYFQDTIDYALGKVTELIKKLEELAARLNVVQQAQAAYDLIRLKISQSTAGNNLGPAMQGRAVGGFGAGPTLVGERGPEIVDLPQGSYVHNSRETERKLRGGGNSVVIQGPLVGSIHVHDAADEDRLIDKVQQSLARMIQLQSLHSA